MRSKDTKSEPSLISSMEDMFILDQCAVIETKCAEFYRHFATLSADIPELVTLWNKTALEEDHHALQFKMLARLKDGIAGVNVDLASVSSALKQLDDLFSRIRQSKLTHLDTLRVGIKLEEHLSKFHADAVVICEDPDMANLLEAMMKIDREHTQMLQSFLDRLESAPPASNP